MFFFWIHEMKVLWNTLRTFICLCGWLKFWISFSREPLVGNFWGFLHEVRVSSKLKSDRARFLKKILLLGFGQNAPKTRFFRCYEKSPRGTFQIFCMMLQKHELLKLTNTSFFWKNFVWRFWGKKGPKWAQYEVLQVLWKIGTEIFRFSAWSYTSM